jgi:hypothetical protein
MNERIGELAEQARKYVADAIELGFPQDQVDDIRDEKFAELIVRECMALCKSIDETDTQYRYDYRRGVLDCVDTIKEHFGVKE